MKINIVETQRALSATQISLADYVINPYRGCSLGCRFCYVRFNKNVAKREEAWGEFIDVKKNLPALLSQELERSSPARVLLGSTTEVFMPEEKKFRLTEKVIRILAGKKIPCVILSRAPLIESCLPFLAYHKKNKIYFTFIRRPPEISRRLEPKSAAWQTRRKTLKAIIEAGVSLRLHIGPFIPYLDSLADTLQVMPEGIKEIEVEVLNPRLGNWPELKKLLGSCVKPPLLQKISSLYAQEQLYAGFCHRLGQELAAAHKEYRLDVSLLISSCGFYTPDIIYEP